jgi:hypothetical protein
MKQVVALAKKQTAYSVQRSEMSEMRSTRDVRCQPGCARRWRR